VAGELDRFVFLELVSKPQSIVRCKKIKTILFAKFRSQDDDLYSQIVIVMTMWVDL